MRAIEPPTGVMMMVNTDRKKVLQMIIIVDDVGDAGGISRASVARRTFLLIRRLPAPIPESSLEAASKAVVADEHLPATPRA
jgi:hypothetical protein